MIAVALQGPAAAFVAGGGRDIDHAGPIEPGTHVRITDERGHDLGLAVADPDNGKLRMLATAADGFAALDGALLGWRVERAIALRRRLGLVGAGQAYRLIHGAGDGLPGFACDVLGTTAVVYAYGAGLRALGRQLAAAVVGFAGLEGAVVKLRARGGASEAEVGQDVVGTAPAEQVLASEAGVTYEIHPLAGLNHGLFTDMREQRRDLGRLGGDGARVLNLFSYTGSLGLACARAGAASVTSVDTSPGVQAWARGNFGRSGLTGDRWRFETGDAARFLTRAAKDKERYDLVIIDPPSTSSAGGGSWALGRDYPALIAKAAAVVPSDGVLWLAANTHDLGSLAKLAHKGLRGTGRSAAIIAQGGLPPEYPTLAAQPADRYLQICALRLG